MEEQKRVWAEKSKRKFQVVAAEDDIEFLKLMAEESDTTQGFVIHTLLEMVHAVVGTARETGAVDLDAKIATLELFVARTLNLVGVLDDSQFGRVLELADMIPEKNNLLRSVIAQVANEQLDELKPQWEKARKTKAKSARQTGQGEQVVQQATA